VSFVIHLFLSFLGAFPFVLPHSATPAHPEYPSTHQVSVGAILEVLLRTLGRDDVTFSIGSEGTPWLTRSYKTLTAAAKEVGGESACRSYRLPNSNRTHLSGPPCLCWTVDQLTEVRWVTPLHCLADEVSCVTKQGCRYHPSKRQCLQRIVSHSC
jgi:hypothetical protein